MEQSEHDLPVQDPTSHITNTGRIIEDMEIKMRGLLQEVSSFIPTSSLRFLCFSRVIMSGPSLRNTARRFSFHMLRRSAPRVRRTESRDRR